ncbi:hypothetical protein [Amycolatopsis sp.]|uniref:hypothetical protein n=1 Tax=Amycolatopsis sp. TaxID=37632 RepID=UPI002D15B4F3|nr:hypothetical protein [Amycolatopsis sp.]HVV12729.1 hypothetical protein [Amycolatopsis sp.]
MHNELIHYTGDHGSWDAVVDQAASLFNPFTAAGKIITRIGACMVEIKRLNHVSAELQRRHQRADAMLLQHRQTVILLFDGEREHSRQTRIESAALVTGYQNMVERVCEPRVPAKFYDLAQALLPAMSAEIARLTRTRGDNLVRLSDSLRLGDTEAALAAWRAVAGA